MYNIGVERPEISMYDLGMKISNLGRELIGYKGKVVRQVSTEQDYLVDNPDRRCPVIQKARTELGYTPSIELDEGLRRSMIWYYYNQTAEEA
jgi:UDP-glucuronate decarboxylase